MVTVEDAQIVEAVSWTFNRAKVVAEPSGAASVAAVLAGLADAKQRIDGPIVAIIRAATSGWNGWRSEGQGEGRRLRKVAFVNHPSRAAYLEA